MGLNKGYANLAGVVLQRAIWDCKRKTIYGKVLSPDILEIQRREANDFIFSERSDMWLEAILPDWETHRARERLINTHRLRKSIRGKRPKLKITSGMFVWWKQYLF